MILDTKQLEYNNIMNNYGLNIKGIKCDTPHCNYKDDDVPFEDYKNWIDRPCPVCSRSLLTLEDYTATLNISIAYYKSIVFILKHKYLGKILSWILHRTNIELHGEGLKTATYKKEKE